MVFKPELEGNRKRFKKPDPEQIRMSEDDKAVLKHLLTAKWPKGSARYLPAAVRSSMRNYKAFLKRFHEVLKQSKKKCPEGTIKLHKYLTYDDLHVFIQTQLDGSLLPAENYIICWFEAFHSKIVGWRNWPGTIRPFSVHSKEFQNEGYDLATEYGGSKAYKLWDQFMLLMYPEGDNED